MIIVLLLAAVLIVLALSWWAGSLLRQVKVKEIEEAEALGRLDLEAKAQRQRVNKSVQVIAASVLKGDEMSLTEASMRLSVLLESLGMNEDEREAFAGIFKLAEATAHIPILAQWKKLPSKNKLTFDKQRLVLEADYKDFVQQCCRNLIGKEF